MGYPLLPALWLGLLFPVWGLTPILPTLLWVGRGPEGPAATALSLISLDTGLHSQIFSFHSTAKGYDKTTPWPTASLLRPIPNSWGVPPDQWRSLKRPCQPMAALLGLLWANDVASNTLRPSMCAHCRERDWDQGGGKNGETHFWPCI